MEKARQFAAQQVASAEADIRVVVPAHQAKPTLGPCLDALIAAGFARFAITVVDDGSSDWTSAIARARGVRVLRNAVPLRPSAARNRGAAVAGGDVLLFVDADVVVHPDTKARVTAAFRDPTLTALIGSYDDAPAGNTVISRYRNLLHHFTHQDAAGPCHTFWSGLGAVRRDAFEAAGGFDETWHWLEDVELGVRLDAAGAVMRLDPLLQGKHLKQWTLRSMVHTDIFGRAVPWTRLMLSGRLAVGALNTSVQHRISALAVVLVPGVLLLAPFWPAAVFLATLYGFAFLAANARLFWRLGRVGGPGFALAALPYHVLHYFLALTGYAKVRLFERKPV